MRRPFDREVIWPLIAILPCVLFLVIVFRINADSEQLWDFKNYYAPVKVMQAGFDPYDHSNFSLVFPDGNHKRWQYPPIILWLFKPFAYFSYEEARQIWFGINLICLAGLLFVWHRTILPLQIDALNAWFFLLAFNGTLIWGLETGNIVIIKQLLLFLGIGLLLRRKC